MAAVFLDSSALFRRYFQAEPGANRVRAICEPSLGHKLVLARLAPIEYASSLSRRLRDGTLTSIGRHRRWQRFRLHWLQQYEVVEASDEVHDHAERLVTRYPLRTLDALQLASALTLVVSSPRLRPQFWTADRQQAAAAQAEGLDVELVT